MKQATNAALIQLVESIIITAIIAGIVAASSTLTNGGAIDWQITGGVFALAFLFSLAHSLTAYIKTLPAPNNVSMDDLGTVLDDFVTRIEKSLQASMPQKAAGPSPIILGTTVQPQTVQTSQPAPVYDTLPSISAVQPQTKQ